MAARLATAESESAPATLDDFVATLAARGSRTAVIDYSSGARETLSYAALRTRIDCAAGTLRDAGAGPGSTVAIWGPNGSAWIAAYFGVVQSGALVLPLDHLSSATALATEFDHATPDFVVTTEAHRAELAAEGRTVRMLALDGLAERRDPKAAAPPSGISRQLPDTPAALLYTSGTTGMPKAVPLTHRNLLTNTFALSAANLIRASDRVLLPLPLHHTYPFTVGLMSVFAKGAAVVFPAGMSGPEIASAARDSQATALLAVPRLCEALWDGVSAAVARRGPRAKQAFRLLLAVSGGLRRLTGWRVGRWLFRSLHANFGGRLDVIGCGGAHLDLALARRLEALGWTVLTGYGLTETSPVLTFNDRSRPHLGTEGRALPGVELAILPATGGSAVTDSASSGEIVARGASVFGGYRGNEAATRAAFTDDGWFRTGDVGWIDRRGYLHIEGRSKELIVLADGKKVFPEDLEKTYASSKLLREVAILEDRDRLVALVVPDEAAIRERGALRAAALLREEIEDVGGRLPPYRRIVNYRISRTTLPRTHLGKLKRHLLPALYTQANAPGRHEEQLPLAAADAALLAAGRTTEIWRWLQSRFPDRRLTLDTSPQLDLAIDSLEWVALTLEIEERFSVALGGEAVSRILSLRDLLLEINAAAPLKAATTQPVGSATDVRDAGHAGPLPAVGLDTAAAIEPNLAMRALGIALLALCRAIMHFCFRLRVAGRGRLDDDIPMLIAPNHTSSLDPLAIAAALPWRRLRKTVWAGWVGILYAGPFIRLLSRACRVMPVDPDRDLDAAVAGALDALRRGYSVVWFPEGRRSPTGELGPFLRGIGRVAQKSDAIAVPVAIRGTFAALPKHRRLPRFTRVSVTFGEPLRFPGHDFDAQTAAGISEIIESAVRGLLSRQAADSGNVEPHRE